MPYLSEHDFMRFFLVIGRNHIFGPTHTKGAFSLPKCATHRRAKHRKKWFPSFFFAGAFSCFFYEHKLHSYVLAWMYFKSSSAGPLDATETR